MNLFYYLVTLMPYATIVKKSVCKPLSVGILCTKERRDQFRFMRRGALGIFTDVRLYGRRQPPCRPTNHLASGQEEKWDGVDVSAEALAKAEGVPP
jgi:hypothetical protein